MQAFDHCFGQNPHRRQRAEVMLREQEQPPRQTLTPSLGTKKFLDPLSDLTRLFWLSEDPTTRTGRSQCTTAYVRCRTE